MPSPAENNIEDRRQAILDLIDYLGSQKALADAISMTESRLSKALNPEMVSDRRLAPIERAIAEWKEGRFSDENKPDTNGRGREPGVTYLVFTINGQPVRRWKIIDEPVADLDVNIQLGSHLEHQVKASTSN